MKKRFRVALSFSGDHRPFVEKVAQKLVAATAEGAVFYDHFYQAELAKPDSDIHLINIYRNECDLFVVFVSQSYTGKTWCNIEWRVVRTIINEKQGDAIMPFRFDDTPIPGLVGALDGYIMVDKKSPQIVANLIMQRLNQGVTVADKIKIPPPTIKRKWWWIGSLVLLLAVVLLLVKFKNTGDMVKDVQQVTPTSNDTSKIPNSVNQPENTQTIPPKQDTSPLIGRNNGGGVKKQLGKIATGGETQKLPERRDSQKKPETQPETMQTFHEINGTVKYDGVGVSDATVVIYGHGEAKTGKGGYFKLLTTHSLQENRNLKIEIAHDAYKTITTDTPFASDGLQLYFEQKKD